MDKRSVIQTLREHEPELRAAGIVHLRLFGPVARDEVSAGPDIDLMADSTDRNASLLLVWCIWKIASPICSVCKSISLQDSMKEHICNKAILESILAFRRTNLITPFAQKLKENQTTPNCVS